MSGNFEVCPIGTQARLAAVEAERGALKTENERLNGMLSAANWRRAQEEHNALRAERDALVKERDEDRRREYGYSQQVVDALTNERDALRAERDALRAALEVARRVITNDRESLVECSTYPDGTMDRDAADYVAYYDAALKQIDAAKGGGNG